MTYFVSRLERDEKPQQRPTFDGEYELDVAGPGDGGGRTAVGALVTDRHVRNDQRSILDQHVTRYLVVHLAPFQTSCQIVCYTRTSRHRIGLGKTAEILGACGSPVPPGPNIESPLGKTAGIWGYGGGGRLGL